MTDEQIRDLKDFIITVVRQEIGSQIQDQTAELKSEFSELKQSVSDLELKVDTIAEAVGVQFNEQQTVIENHETPIIKLETHPA